MKNSNNNDIHSNLIVNGIITMDDIGNAQLESTEAGGRCPTSTFRTSGRP